MTHRWLPIDAGTDPYEAFPATIDPGELLDAQSLVEILTSRPDWHGPAACRGKGTAHWFPERGAPLHPALAICGGCPVTAECLGAGMREKGVWGGTSERTRRQVRKQAAA